MTYFVAFLIFAAAAGVSLRYNWWRIPQGWHKARVLMYHSVEEHKGDKFDKWRLRPADFERQIAWLAKNGFKSFKFGELIALDQLPKKAVCITFDDGYRDNLTGALPILQKYGFKATIFIVNRRFDGNWATDKDLKKSSDELNREEMLSDEEVR